MSPSSIVRRRAGGRSLSRVELRWARAAFECIFPSNACRELPIGIALLDIEGFLADVRTRAPAEAALGLRIAIWIVGLAPIFVLGRLATIASLAVDDRERVLRALLANRIYAIRQLVVLLKAIGALLYAGAEPVRAFLLPPAPGHSDAALVPLKRLAHEHRSFA
jgi:hypothetical protein